MHKNLLNWLIKIRKLLKSPNINSAAFFGWEAENNFYAEQVVQI